MCWSTSGCSLNGIEKIRSNVDMAKWGPARIAAARELLSSRPTDARRWQAKLGPEDKFVPVHKLLDLQLKQLEVSATAVAATHPPGTRVIGVSVIATPDGRVAVDAIEVGGTKA